MNGKSYLKKLDLLKINFLINPKVRFKNKSGEQGTFFLKDPSGNVLEFKTFKNDADVFKNFNLIIFSIILSIIISCGNFKKSQFELPSLFSDGMVLQRDT